MDFFDPQPDATVAEAEYKRLLGYPRHHELSERAQELADRTRAWFGQHGQPWIYARPTDALELTAERLNISGIEFSSKQLHDQFATAQAQHAVLVAVSAGKECEAKAHEFWQDGKPDEYFFMEMFGSAVVEHLITIASGRICGWADENKMVALPHYSPGYSGWDVADQNKLWSLIQPQNGHALPAELHVLDTGMLRPKKSLLAVFGVTANVEQARRFARLVPCENCSLAGCQYRRTPYQHSLPQIEDVQRLQSRPQNGSADLIMPGLNPAPKYSVNARALRKWAQERLQLNLAPDGSVEARFRYEGTTCSNMGRALAYDYHVQLRARGRNHQIIAASCKPAPDDIGHASQCAYLNNSDELQRNTERETPLLGKPLTDVFAWGRSPNPAGCFCESSARAHKWGLVLEVIHFALVERQQTKSNSKPTVANGFIKSI